MPYFHCNDCHHEFESCLKAPKCDWCGADSYMTEDQTPFEQLTNEIEKMGIDKFFERLESKRNRKEILQCM